MNKLDENKTESRSKNMMGLIVGLLFALIAIVIGIAVFILINGNFGGGDNDDTGAPVIQIQPPAPTVGEKTFVTLSHPLNTNLLGGVDGRDAHITLDFSIAVLNTEANSDEVIRLLRDAEPVVRHIALSVIRDMTFTEVNARNGAEIISAALLRRLQDEFGSNLIIDVYIDDMVSRRS